MIISIEGVDCAGKSTQCQLLKEKLESEGKKVKVIHFPSKDSKIGKCIYEILDDNVEIDKLAMQMLYIADQVNTNSYLRELESEGYVVILDRYRLSSVVYYVSTMMKDSYYDYSDILRDTIIDSLMKQIVSQQTKLIEPDITVILSLNGSEVKKRKEQLDKFEKDEKLMKVISDVYLKVARKINKGDTLIRTIDATLSVEEVHEMIYSICNAM